MKHTRLLCLLTACLLMLCGCTQNRSGSFERALDLFADGNYAEAAEAFARLGD